MIEYRIEIVHDCLTGTVT